jgi:hypothetical protein
MSFRTGIVKAIRYQKNENKPLCQQISGRYLYQYNLLVITT